MTVFAVTLRADAEMVVWVEASSVSAAKAAAKAGDYDVMTEWTPRTQGAEVEVAEPEPSVLREIFTREPS